MIDRVKYFWEKLALVTLVLVFLFFEIRLILVVHEYIIEALFGLVNLYLFIELFKNLKRYLELRWQKQ